MSSRKVTISILLLSSLFDGSKGLLVGNIKIVGQSGGIAQYLPGSYINTVPRWRVESGDQAINLNKLIGTGFDADDDDSASTAAKQFVNPSSNIELWWPSDLEKVQIRPTLDVFVKGAIPTYLLAGIEVRVPKECSKDGRAWSNFGMNSQPLATQWTDFNIAVENGFRVQTLYGKVLQQKDEESGQEEKVEWMAWDRSNACATSDDELKLEAMKGTGKAMQTLGNLLASIDEESPIADGMHIISVPIQKNWMDLPQINVGSDEMYKLVSVGTVEPDVLELMKQDEDLIAMSATSVLNVGVSSIAPGSESEYIPECYKPLYMDN